MYIGQGKWVDLLVWAEANRQPPELFFQTILTFIVPEKELMNKCLDIRKVTVQLEGLPPIEQLADEPRMLAISKLSHNTFLIL